ncbi:hypothetical protein UFOVP236_68 [uncultured Caudovirales phage]|uniref:Uncharacterized protein n=1 Tax=uncultured Caudovirales phage TaxID=2100421 RepID=A0A6J7WRN8_9CAUD|nr:hypothetical protein UFOVP236_68 [uncultured Caudovirales phage]
MKYANIQLSWDITIQVPIKDLSSVLELLNKYPLVRQAYDDNETYYHEINKEYRVDLTNKEPEKLKRSEKSELKVAA